MYMRKRYKILAILALLLNSVSLQVFAQYNTANFDHISVEDGLSQSEVYTILKDRQGFMWFGTVDGLNKYNGYSFIHYKHDPYDSTTISHNHIYALHEDRAGNLWVGTLYGLNRLDKTTNKFIRYDSLLNNDKEPRRNIIHSIYEDKWNTLWLATNQGLKRMVKSSPDNTYQLFTYKSDSTDTQSLSNNRVLTIFEDKAGSIWVGTAQGLNLMHVSGNSPEQQKITFNNINNSNKAIFSLSHPTVTALAEDNYGNLWVGTHKGLNKIDAQTNAIEHFYHQPDNPHSISDNVIEALLVDQKGEIWIGTQTNGICKIIPEDKNTIKYLVHFKDDFFANKGLKSNMIYSLYESKDANEDVIWIGTRGAGVNKFSRSKNKFVLWSRITGQEGSFASNSTFAIHTDRKNNLWIGSQKGLIRINRKTNQYKRFTYDPKDANSLSNDMVQHIYEDKQGNLWIGTHYGLNKFDPEEENFTRIFFNDHHKKYAENEIAAMYEDSYGNFWIGTAYDLKKFERAGGKTITSYTHNPKDTTSLHTYFVTSIIEDKRGTLWVGTLSGLNKFNRDKQNFTPYLHQQDNPQSISSNMVWSIVEDQQSNLWICTNQGVNKLELNQSKENFIHFTEKQGLSNNYVYGALTDREGAIWMSTNLGISRFDPVTQTFKNFDVSDGLPNNEFNSGAFHKSEEGELFFGGNSGVVSFHPEEIQNNLHIPNVQITTFKKFEKPLNVDSLIASAGEIKLSYKENFFSFEFVALDYTNPRKNQYAFKLDGFHEEWIPVGSRRFASFTNLSPGSYTFRVKGSNSDGIWNDLQEATIKLIITPPFWKTPWFFIAAFILISIALKLLYDYRVKMKVHRLMEMEKVKLAENERVRKLAAEDLHDEFGNRLTRISLLTELIKARLNGHGAEVNHLLTKISDNSNQLYQGTKDFIWSINPENDSLYEVAVRLKDFGDDLFDKTSVTFNATGVNERLKPIILPMGDSRHLILLFKEAMSNILKHAACNNVHLAFCIENNQIWVCLSDDGKGFEKEKEKSGNGLMNMQSRAKKLNGVLQINSVKCQGTQIKFSLKMPQTV